MARKFLLYCLCLFGLTLSWQLCWIATGFTQGQETVAIVYTNRSEMNLHGDLVQTIPPIVRNNRLYISLTDLARILDLKPDQISLTGDTLEIITERVSVEIKLPAYSMKVNGVEVADLGRIAFGEKDRDHVFVSIRPILKAFNYEGFLREEDQSFYVLKGLALAANDLFIQGLEIGQSNQNELTRIFGKPQSIQTSSAELTTGMQQTWSYGDIRFDVSIDADAKSGSLLTGAHWTTPIFATSRGIRVGDSQSAVIQAYGYGYYRNSYSGRYEYTFLTSHWEWKGLAFVFEANRVKEIELFDRAIR